MLPVRGPRFENHHSEAFEIWDVRQHSLGLRRGMRRRGEVTCGARWGWAVASSMGMSIGPHHPILSPRWLGLRSPAAPPTETRPAAGVSGGGLSWGGWTLRGEGFSQTCVRDF